MQFQDHKLFFTVGDFSLDRINGLSSDIAPQNPSLPWGKVSYIDIKTGKYNLFTMGHRNPQGLAILNDGRILSTEHGPQGGDELNLLEVGKNYGWPYQSLGTHYGSYREYKDDLPPLSPDVMFQGPIFAFVPSPALTQVIQVHNFHPKWNGDLLIGSLKEKTIFRVRLNGNSVQVVEPILINHRIRDLKEMGGNIFVLTDEGKILRISPGTLKN